MDRAELYSRVNKTLLKLELSTKAECERIKSELSSRQKSDPFLKDHEIDRIRISFHYKESSKKLRPDDDNVAAAGEVGYEFLCMPSYPSKYCRIFMILVDAFGYEFLEQRLLNDLGEVYVDIVVWHQAEVHDFVNVALSKD